MLGVSQLLLYLQLKLLDLLLKLLLLLKNLLHALLELRMLLTIVVVATGAVVSSRDSCWSLLLLLRQDVLFQLLQLRDILLQSRQLLLVGDSILLESSQGGLVLLLQLSLLQHLLLQLLVQLLQLL